MGIDDSQLYAIQLAKVFDELLERNRGPAVWRWQGTAHNQSEVLGSLALLVVRGLTPSSAHIFFFCSLQYWAPPEHWIRTRCAPRAAIDKPVDVDAQRR